MIELTSPQGTTVRLVQHPGGPDNGGERFRQHDLRRRGGDERLDRKRALHRQLQAPERPALALRRRAAPGNLDAARARSLRGRRRHLDELADDDAPRHLRLRGSGAPRYRDNGGTVGARRLAQRVVQLRRKRRRCQLRVQPGRRTVDGVRHAAWRGRPRRRHAHPARAGPRRRGQPRSEPSRAKLDSRYGRATGFALDASSGRVTTGRSARNSRGSPARRPATRGASPSSSGAAHWRPGCRRRRSPCRAKPAVRGRPSRQRWRTVPGPPGRSRPTRPATSASRRARPLRSGRRPPRQRRLTSRSCPPSPISPMPGEAG